MSFADTTESDRPTIDAPDSRWLDKARRRRAWLVLAAVLVAGVSWLLATDQLARTDRLLQEGALNLVRPAAAGNIVIVAIDDKSLEAIGRWPWRRALHAKLLQQISAGKPRCIGLDLLLDDANAEFPADDAMLARSMRSAGCVVLPLAMQVPSRNSQLQSEVLPTAELSRAATALGHSHLSVDADGVVEGMYLFEGFPGREWPHFSMAMRDAAEGRLKPQPSILEGGRSSPPEGRWTRRHQELILYNAPTTPFLTVSYIDVLDGTAPRELFHDRYVLVGATADSVADFFAVAAPTQNGLVPGVEIFATVLQSLVRHTHIHPASDWQNLLYNLAPLVIALLGLLWLGPLGVFSLVVCLLLGMGALQVAQPWTGIRFSVAPGLGGLLAVYPLWSLMRLSTAYRFLQRGTRELNAVLEGLPRLNKPAQEGDFLDREMDATATAVQRVRDMHRFIRDAMDHMPDTMLVLDRLGRVFYVNRGAARLWHRQGFELAGVPAHELLADLRSRRDGQPMVLPGLWTRSTPRRSPAKPRTLQGASCCCAACPSSTPTTNTQAGWWRWWTSRRCATPRASATRRCASSRTTSASPVPPS
ncbi:CHASE2 domain-containing protein [Variovorax sp. OV329]|uniref:CHASE2 domain-containing protein n=1 Tax=Variovorax sp. OV329 TaxID=1882825 RepID=UPI0008EF9BA8|nr:CHASE2 domain-containing protein [Variovorax sp. OV329]SFM35115.1 sensor domain CHASE2-containing protein [Variovorax sp. OV329]